MDHPFGELAAMASGEFTPVQASLKHLLTEGTMTGVSESQLLDRFCSQGDEYAFEVLLRRHGPMVLAVCRRVLSDPNDVEDAFQATFLILVKKAGSIRNRAVLGTWLHGVARRVAVRSQIDSRRRRARERGDAEITAREDRRTSDANLAELRAIIDEEVTRLTDTYRTPLVLCDLEGQTYEQAAAQLRCPVGTVKSRLARAREKLRSRLARRGLAPSVGILAVALAPEPAAAVTSDLLGSTIGPAVRLVTMRQTAAGAVSAAVAALVDGTLRSMSMSAMKNGVIVLAVAGMIATGAGVFGYQAPERKSTGSVKNLRTESSGETKVIVEKMKAEQAADPDQSIAALARARLAAAQRSLEAAHHQYNRAATQVGLDELHTSALRVLDARRDVSDANADHIAAIENYVAVMKSAEQRAKAAGAEAVTANAEYYRTEAELWLAQARAGREPNLPGNRTGAKPGGRPGMDPRSQALLARLEETIPMNFPKPTPLEDVLKYIQQATAGPNGEGIPIYVDPVELGGINEDKTLQYEKLMKTPITMDLVGVPLRRTLKLLAEQLGMGYGIRDGMVTMREPDMRFQNWHELLVMEESFPQSSPLDLEIERARRGELTRSELEELDQRLKSIEEVTKRAQSIRMMRFTPVPATGGMMRGTQSPPSGPRAPAP